MRKMIDKVMSGSTDPGVKEYEAGHRLISRKAAAEGMVMLENRDGLLPIPAGSKVALYGGASRIVKGGTGSGDVNEREVVSITQGMKNAGYEITDSDWMDDYERRYTLARFEWKNTIEDKIKKDKMQPFDAYAFTPFVLPAGMMPEKTDAEYAFYFLSRIAGEGADRTAAKGDYYISDEEKKVLTEICRIYPKVIAVLNVGGPVDLSFVDELKIGTLIQMSQPGMEAGNAFADIVSGKVTPSGKLTDTWAQKYEEYPSSPIFSYNKGKSLDEKYEEGIYVGYRYFDSFHKPVRYCFGYGRSYTEFSMEMKDFSIEEKGTENPIAIVSVDVKNTGTTFSGKEIVEVYCSLPQGRMEREFRRFVGFGKTSLLAPGESEIVDISFPLYLTAGYDCADAKWIMEKGMYGIWVGGSLDTSALSAVVSAEEDITFIKVHNICPLKEELHELSKPKSDRDSDYSRWVSEGTDRKLKTIEIGQGDVIEKIVDYDNAPKVSDEAEQITSSLSDAQLISLAKGDPGRGQMSEIGSAGITVPGAAGETSSEALGENVPSIVLADGPAGLRIEKSFHVYKGAVIKKNIMESMAGDILGAKKQFEDPGEVHYQFATAIPVGTLLAQTFNTELIEEVGDMVGEEMENFHVTLWLAPGMNIHRNPLCGRNFEYYSEDPVLTGLMAAAMTMGVQSNPGVGTTIKHFCCNNRENDRMESNSIVSERALREIYLKGFEIAVGLSQPMSIMTSYNRINGVFAANNHDICTEVARKEWGFAGVIMTDWLSTNHSKDCTSDGCMRAGNDLVMPGMDMDDDNIRKALADGSLSHDDLHRSIAYLIDIILESNQYEGSAAYGDKFTG